MKTYEVEGNIVALYNKKSKILFLNLKYYRKYIKFLNEIKKKLKNSMISFYLESKGE